MLGKCFQNLCSIFDEGKVPNRVVDIFKFWYSFSIPTIVESLPDDTRKHHLWKSRNHYGKMGFQVSIGVKKMRLFLAKSQHTLLYEMPSNSEGKNFVWKIYWNFPLNMRVLPADSDGGICKKWMQNILRFLMKSISFSSLINNFKIRIKSYLSKRKNWYFSSEIWGRFAFTFCRYFHQNLQVLPSESVAGNTLRFRGKFQYIFQTKFFPLEFEGISYNSVAWFVSTRQYCGWCESRPSLSVKAARNGM